jgi:hypothetical protein
LANAKFEEVGRMMRYGAMSFLTQLDAVPAERRNWRPEPAAPSAMEIAAEVISVFRMYRPLLESADSNVEWVRIDRTPPKSVDEAREKLIPVVEAYIEALEGSGPELRRRQPMPFGGVFWAEDAAMYPLLDLMHHHGQLCYLQALLGDAEQHWDDEAIERCFMRETT